MSDHKLDSKIPTEVDEDAPWGCIDTDVLTKICPNCGERAEVPDCSHCGHIFGNEPEHKENPKAGRLREEPTTWDSDEWGDSNRDHDSVQFDPLATAIDPRAEELVAAITTIKSAIACLLNDPGAVFTDALKAAWNVLYDGDHAEFERLRSRAKAAGARVTEIDKVVGARNKRVKKPPSRLGGAGLAMAVPSQVDSPSASGTPTAPALGCMPPGALLDYSENGQPRRKVQSEAASLVASVLSDWLRWDAESGTWLRAQLTHWEPQSTPAKAVKQIATSVDIGTRDGPVFVGYTPDYLNGVIEIIQKQGLLPPPDPPANVVPFLNGLLDIATGALTVARPDYATRYVLPHHYDPTAECPTIRAWLLRTVGGDPETVELLRAWLAALVRGIPLQKFLLLRGRGGSGKGTFQRLAAALVGQQNVAISALRDLEENRFELAKLIGKRLCMINEAGRHGGSLNMLKAVTGGDHLPIERKHQQQHGSFVFEGLMLMASNEDLRSTDHTSGLERRRLIVRFPHSATPEEKAEWHARGGEAAVLHLEIPGLIRWVLELPVADIHRLIESPPVRVARENLLGMAAGNNVADWLMERTVPEPRTMTQVGHKQECRDRDTGATYYEHADERLYPNYLTWCLETATRPVALQRFANTVVDIAETLGHAVERMKHPTSRAAVIRGLRLRRPGTTDTEEPWTPVASGGGASERSPEVGPKGSRGDAGGIEPAPRMDRMDLGRQLSSQSGRSQGGVSSTSFVQESASTQKSAPLPSDSFATRAETLRDPSVTPPNPPRSEGLGAVVGSTPVAEFSSSADDEEWF